MQTNQELRTAWDFVEHTGISIFLTGKAGTGKTTFLRALKEHSSKTMIVVAPTGVAAVNAAGVTIHSFFQLPLSPFVPGARQGADRYGFSKDKLKIVRALDLLVIDEISMVRADLLDAIDAALRKYRRSPLPFGGVQLLMIGDLQQLAPVVTPADEALLRPYYSTPYFFGSHALAQIPYVTIQLTRVYRQQNARFVELLNHVRAGHLTPDDCDMLASRLDRNFRPAPQSDYIRLTTHNAQADDYNTASLLRLPGSSQAYRAHVEGDFPEMSFPTSRALNLKVGAQVMFIKNDTEGGGRYYNGRIGHVTGLGETSVTVRCPGDDYEIEVGPQLWENTKYSINPRTNTVESSVEGTFAQLPLRLAWAVTIHKSQGLTFDHVIIDAGASFAPGQVYVALSRCRTLEGIVLATPIPAHSLLNDPSVAQYISGQDAAAERSVRSLPSIKEEYRRHLLKELFNFREITDLQESLHRLIARDLAFANPAQNAAQASLADDLRQKITAVADRWLATIASSPMPDLSSTQLLERVKAGCRYFSDTLRELFGSSIGEAARCSTGDKKLRQRLTSLTTDLRLSLSSRLTLLDDISVHGFTVVNYLHFKQQATLGASAAVTARKSDTRKVREPRAAKTPKKVKTPKEPREKTADISLRMLRQGMTRREIAEERQLAVSTVTGHLQQFIQSGELTMEEVYTPPLVTAMADAVAKCGPDNFEQLMGYLKDTGLSPYDLRFYLSSLR